VIPDWLFAAQPHVSMTFLSQDIPFDLFEWKSMELVARAL